MIFINLSHPTHSHAQFQFQNPFYNNLSLLIFFHNGSTALLAQPTAVQPTPTLRLTHLTADSLSQSRSLTHTLRWHPFASDPAAVASISAIASNSSLQSVGYLLLLLIIINRNNHRAFLVHVFFFCTPEAKCIKYYWLMHLFTYIRAFLKKWKFHLIIYYSRIRN